MMQIVAHRGNARDHPENTLPAFESALALGVRHLELDVQLSADGVPMVLHDATLKRTTGLKGRVHDRTASELVKTTNVPRLADVVALLGERPDVTLFVEIKRESLDRFGTGMVVDRIVKAIAPRRDQCVAISFDLPALEQARDLGHSSVGWVLSDMREKSRAAAAALKPEFLFVDHKKLPRRGPLWPGGWQWVVYEVTTMLLARSLERRGVQFIETMAVARMTRALS